MKNPNIIIIDKENVPFLNFPKEDVLNVKQERSQRCTSLFKAMRLGNLERQKVRILFKDDEGIKQVETTIWGVTNKRVILKKAINLPINRVLSVS
ncbi:hypothetical protein [Flagellimonas meridianipacifica]|uniref:Uncharacterized protein n=1 Tax=Flagellimonas meridianipacifica TaxID=1080225 RepID=A0A2T0MB19_9FLAO|nr:hypothetical protein [Allomuricauda pacifica]PRX54689.1 hypothetical protein CLV81_3093 [Allomuricauda pacifica]